MVTFYRIELMNADLDLAAMECTFCGGLGHRITNCPKLELQKRQQMASSITLHTGGRGDY